MKTRTKWVVGALAVLCILTTYYLYHTPEQIEESPITIGVIAPFTGPGAAWGDTIHNGATLAAEHVNAAGGVRGKELRILFEDDQLDVNNSVLAVNKLIDVDHALAIVGPAGSANAKAAVPLVEAQRTPTILTAVGLSDITKDREFVFRIWPSELMKVRAMRPALEVLGYERIAVITTNHESSLDTIKQLRAEVLSDLDIEVVHEEIVSRDTTDFRTAFAKIKTTDFDALFVNLYAGQIGIGSKQARELGITQPMFSNVLADSPKELELSEDAMEGIWFPGSPVPTNDFANQYAVRFGVDAERAAPTTYDAVMMLAEVARRYGTGKGQIQTGLYEITDYQGAFGNITLDENGDALLDLPLKTVENGSFVKFSL